jgi:hypothetical protein
VIGGGAPDRSFVDRVIVRGGDGDAVRARLRMEALLGGAQLHPPGLPPSAILCVRHLRDPLPGTLALDGQAALPRAWERALAASLTRLARSAARPLDGGVPAAAEAVLFGDGAELLACLASDLVDGSLVTRWWWRHLLRAAGGVTAVARVWCAAPAAAPAALALLAERGRAVAFVAALGAAPARSILVAVAERFAAGAVLRALAAGAPAATAMTPAPAPAGEASALAAPPWLRWAPESAEPTLPVEARWLIGIGLGLARAPSQLRAPQFALELAAWSAVEPAVAAPPRPAATPAHLSMAVPQDAPAAAATAACPPAALPAHAPLAPPTDVDARGATPAPTGARPPDASPSPPSEPTAATVATAPVGRDGPPPSSTAASAAGAATAVLASAADPVDAGAGAAVEPAADPAATPDPGPPAAARSAESARLPTARSRFPAGGVATTLGGVFYLVNVALHLGLYGDSPEGDALALPLWDFVALVGRALAGDGHGDDPVWPLLAELAGRAPDQPPGADFTPPPDWRLPVAWQRPFVDGAPASWSIVAGRLLVTHAAGFTILDVPALGDPAAQLGRELGDLPLVAAAAPPLLPATSARQRWLDRLVACISAGLRVALDLEPSEDVGGFLLVHAARVHVSPSRVDVVLALEQLPVAIRLVGLDRDPGFIPAAGRTVAFHFE